MISTLPGALEAARRILGKGGSRNSFGRDAKIVAGAFIALSAQRDEALEEAAKVVRNTRPAYPRLFHAALGDAAERIRSLKAKP